MQWKATHKDRTDSPPKTPTEGVISIIGANMTIEGDSETEGSLRIEGTIRGDVRAGKSVVIGRGGLPQQRLRGGGGHGNSCPLRSSLLLAGTVLLALGCGDTGGLLVVVKPVNPSMVLLPNELCSDNGTSAIATFEDDNLLAVVRSTLGLGSIDDLTCNLLPGLATLGASTAGIESLVGIQNLTNLTSLQLNNNDITALSSLSGLTALANLTLDDNPDLGNIQPLLNNSGLATGDNVSLTNTSVRCVDVVALEAKGVSVTSDCP